MASAQNTLIMMPSGVTKVLNIKPALIEELAECSSQSRISLSRMVNEALDIYCECVAPIYVQSAETRRRQKV